MTQIQRLTDYLKENKTVSGLEAWRNLGIYRLSARIHELRRSGFIIDKEPLGVVNQFGEGCVVANYIWSDENDS